MGYSKKNISSFSKRGSEGRPLPSKRCASEPEPAKVRKRDDRGGSMRVLRF